MLTGFTLLAFPVGNNTISFVNDSPWNSQGVGQHCISGIERLTYHHSGYRPTKLDVPFTSMWFLVSSFTLLATFPETPVTFQAYFFQKNSEL